jgi:chromosome segregation ATPase
MPLFNRVVAIPGREAIKIGKDELSKLTEKIADNTENIPPDIIGKIRTDQEAADDALEDLVEVVDALESGSGSSEAMWDAIKALDESLDELAADCADFG